MNVKYIKGSIFSIEIGPHKYIKFNGELTLLIVDKLNKIIKLLRIINILIII